MPNVREIVKDWLREHGYDGLYSDDCACTPEDLMPCCEACELCEAGYKHPAEDGAECDFYIKAEKPEEPPVPSHLEIITAERARLVQSLQLAVAWLESPQDPVAVLDHLGIHLMERVGSITVGFSPEAWHGLTVVSFAVTYGPMTSFTAEDVAALRAVVEEVADVHSDWNGEGAYSYSIALNLRAGPGVHQCLANYHAAGFEIFDQEWWRTRIQPTFPEGWR